MRKESFMSTWTDNLVFLKDGVYRRFLANDSIVLNGASITAATFVGDLTGNADSATSAGYATSAGNATTADASSGTLALSFAGGDVTGSASITSLTSSYSIALSIGAGVVTNSMLAGGISDDKLDAISSSGKVLNSATSATDANTSLAIVSRDASGNFSAGTITAALSGNASTASAWATGRNVTFDIGDVTGSFSIDGSTDVSNVALTLASVVTAESNYGSASEYLSLSWDAKGRITSYSKGNIAITAAQVTDLATVLGDYVPTTRQVLAGTGLTGGGALSADVTLSLESIGTALSSYGSATETVTLSIDVYGRVTALAKQDIQLASTAAVTGLDTALGQKANLSGATFTGAVTTKDLTVDGNLTVTGTVSSGGTENTLTQDQFITLDIGNVSGTAKPTGIAANVRGSASVKTEISALVAGIAATSNPVMTVDDSSAFAIDDLIQISGTTSNDGLYLVKAKPSSTQIEIYGVGLDALPAYLPFCHNQFVAETVTGTAYAAKSFVSVSAFSDGASLKDSSNFAIPLGELCTASGDVKSSFDQKWVSAVSGAGPTYRNQVVTGVAIGDVLYVNTSSKVAEKADNVAANGHYRAILVAAEANGTGSTQNRKVATLRGQPVTMNFVEATPAAGAMAYLSATAGKATTTRPESAGDAQVELGIVKDDGASNQASVYFEPRVIAVF